MALIKWFSSRKDQVPCNMCAGTGHNLHGNVCKKCKGEGIILREELNNTNIKG